MEVYPSLAFDSLFDNKGVKRNKSVLDRVQDEAKSLGGRVSAADRSRLDEYLESVRDVEKRVTPTRETKEKAGATGKPLAGMPRPADGLPEDIREHMRLMCDLVALGFQTDKTRIATLLLCRDISGLFYPFLDVRAAHHSASHDDKSEGYERVTRYYVSQMAYLTGRLAAMPEGDGTILDHSCLLFLSNMFSGTKHDNSKLPVLQVGTLSGTIQTGRVLDFAGKSDAERRMCSLYLSVADRMGVRLDSFGDATTRLAGF
jgi:hypothetical protein